VTELDILLRYHIYLETNGHKTMSLFLALKEAITSGAFTHGSRLPPSRELAKLYEISRGTVNEAYSMLQAEGYVQGETGRGTIVVYRNEAVKPMAELVRSENALSAWAHRLEQAEASNPPPVSSPPGDFPVTYDMRIGSPNIEWFPYEAWNRELHACIRRLPERKRWQDEEVDSMGFKPLREAIAAYLRRARGLDAQAGHIAIVQGSMQAIALLMQLLLDPGDTAVVEEPCYRGIRLSIRTAGGIPVLGRLDKHGLIIEDWDSRLAAVTPGRQFPTGAVLPLERRQQLLSWARKHHSYIIEDDYDSEFRHKGRPIEPLKALDRDGRVIFIGTFSRSMFPGLRLGYVLLPDGIREAFRKAQALYEPNPANLLEQQALSAFMLSGQFERHLRRMKRVYSWRFHTLSSLLQNRLSDRFRMVDSDSGLHLFAWWTGTNEEYVRYREECRRQGIVWSDAGHCFADEACPVAVMFGFTQLDEAKLTEAMERMAAIR
jgi:GntR family transcriptional regulator / MocR family aminotransferase